MRSRNDSNTRIPSPPSTAFPPAFLSRLDARDEPPTAREAEVAGLAAIHPVPGRGFCLFLPGARPGAEALPIACFTERWRALLAAAVLAGTGRDPAYVLRQEPDPAGFALLSGLSRDGEPEVAGHLLHFDEGWAAALHTADALLCSPEHLALLLEAAGKVALERTGAVLDTRVPAPGEQP
jgi:hypothetical protein